MSLIGSPTTNRRIITFNYSLKDGLGNLIDQSGKEPLAFLEGAGQIIPKLEEQVVGMLIGSKRNIKLKAEDAYGIVDPALMFDVPKQELAHLPLEVGGMLQMNMGEQIQVVRISKIVDEKVTLDGNHPLAGQDLEFDIELVDTRAATQEELAHGHAHGAGGHHH